MLNLGAINNPQCSFSTTTIITQQHWQHSVVWQWWCPTSSLCTVSHHHPFPLLTHIPGATLLRAMWWPNDKQWICCSSSLIGEHKNHSPSLTHQQTTPWPDHDRQQHRHHTTMTTIKVRCHFWDSTSNSNPKTESHLIFKQKPDKLMFGVSVCPDFMLALTIQLDDYCLQELAAC